MKELRRHTLELAGENVVRWRHPGNEAHSSDAGAPKMISSIKMEASIELIQSLAGQTFRIDKVTIPPVEKADTERIKIDVVELGEE